ncbi:hypothetical protein H310_01607 [Aphanomyces invadans]|uniref:Uncharacterized protein n=1 Tax=Aphanomyces invadans TaxID=157072 RepID=A0A024URU9_9STRA|nr:hypothetical protein H310_01607 [Aphanomyces invadans]ETW09181.1 hypothetical protein H310_01607 [Aphanomyces invadans]|eukprot:XP_008862986.1 hypothetical protein H310_01607 [Aphanomyces invadans]
MAVRSAPALATTDEHRVWRLGQHGKALFRHAVTHQVGVDESCRSDEDVSNITLKDNESIESELENFDEWKLSQEDKDPRALVQRGSESLRATIGNKRRAQNTFVFSG